MTCGLTVVHRDQLRTQRSVTSMGSLLLAVYSNNVSILHHIRPCACDLEKYYFRFDTILSVVCQKCKRSHVPEHKDNLYHAYAGIQYEQSANKL